MGGLGLDFGPFGGGPGAFPVRTDGQAEDWFGAPQAFPEEVFWLRIAGQIKETGRGGPHRPAFGFAQVIDAGPDELPGDEIVVAGRQPLVVAGAVLAAQERAVGIGCVVGGVEIFLIIVAYDVELGAVAGNIRQFRKGDGRRDRPGRVMLLDDCDELPGDAGQPLGVRLVGIVHHFLGRFAGVVVARHRQEARVAIGIVGVVDFVADAPQDDRRMVVLYAFPLVEGFVDDQEAQRIAEVQQLGVGRIVAHADGVATHGLEFGKAIRPDRRGDSRAQAAGVVVQADSLQLQIGVVEEEAPIRVETEGPDADGGRGPVCCFPIRHDLRSQRVQ